ncbi:RNA methyltransferase tRNA(m5U54)methyltransferase [Xylographa parallela]|nr:RNA methyltransferase tRNA(m5U54)methyltransferase [Xylographa parallela]
MGSLTDANDTVSPSMGSLALDIATYDGKQYDIVKEGRATILNPRPSSSPTNTERERATTTPPQTVFYNPIQQFNRDLSVLAIRIYGDDLASIRRARQEKRLQDSKAKSTAGKKRKREEDCCSDQLARPADDQPLETVNGTSHHYTASETSYSHSNQGESLPLSGKAVSHLLQTAETNQSPPGTGLPDPNSKIETASGAGISQPSPKSASIPQVASPFSADGNHETKPISGNFRVLDALSATGLRALRYAKEIPWVTSVTANDLSASATDSIKLNVQHNRLSGTIHTVTGNALEHMYRIGAAAYGAHEAMPDGTRGRYEVIDLDPYGTAAPFLDAAVQALADNGLLCVTCTDSGVFASVGYLEKTYAQYGGLPSKGPQSHEAGLRLILHAIATSAARYGMAIEPLLSLSIDFYARVFVRVRRSAAEAKFLAGKTMLVYNCDHGCGAWNTQFLANNKAEKNKKGDEFYKYIPAQAPTASSNCEHCGFKTHLCGPMWGGHLHNPFFIQRILDELPSLSKETYGTLPRLEGMLSIALEESLLDSAQEEMIRNSEKALTELEPIGRLDPSRPDKYPFFIIPSVLAKVLHCVAPSDAALRGALINLGYRVRRSHTKPGTIRTDTPWTVIWEVMREWVRQKAPVKDGAIKPGTAGWAIMRKDRSRASITELKEQLQSIMEKADDLETAKVQIEAALLKSGRAREESTEEAATTKGSLDRTEGDRKTLKVVFDEKVGKDMGSKKLVRYQLNPKPNWGPMTRAKGGS